MTFFSPLNSRFVSVVMTTFNVEDYIEKAISSVLNQTHQNFELIIIDDQSSDNTIEKIKAFNDPRIKLYQNKINAGTYFCKNFGVSIAKGDFIAIHDSDDTSAPNRLENQLKGFEIYPNASIIKCNYVRVNPKGEFLTEPKSGFQTSLIKKEVYEEIGFYDCVRVAADEEFEKRFATVKGTHKIKTIRQILYFNLLRGDSLTETIKIGGSERENYVKEFSKWHQKNVDQPKELFLELNQTKNNFEVAEKIAVTNTNMEDRFERIKLQSDFITGSMVSIPSRLNSLEQVVNTVIDQIDSLRIYLNNVDSIPEFLEQNPKITVYDSRNCDGDLADNGKFYGTDQLTGFHFTFDDDILYPKDYVQKHIEAQEKYNYSAVTGYHGVIINQDRFNRYYEDGSRQVFSFYLDLKEDQVVHILGTGTVAYHTNCFRFDLSQVSHKFMVDIFFGIQALDQNVPLVCIEREENWMTEVETPEDSRIFNNHNQNDDVQSKLIDSRIWTITIPFNFYCESISKESSVETGFLKSKLNNLLLEMDGLRKSYEWYQRTYDHLPKWYLKIGGIFRKKIFRKNS